MPLSVHAKALQRAAHLIGGAERLRIVLKVSRRELEAWMAGLTQPPLSIFLQAVDIVSSPDAGESLPDILDEAMDIAGADKGNVQIAGPDGLRIVAQRGFDRAFLEFFARVDDEGSACGVALKRGERIVVEDVASHPIFADTAAGCVMAQAGATAVQSTPLIAASGRIVGVLSTHRRKPGAPSPGALARLDGLARRLAYRIEAAAR